MIKKLLLLATFILSLNAGRLVINKQFNTDIMNLKLDNVPELYTYDTIQKLVADQYGFMIHSVIPEVEGDKKFFRDNDEKVGEFLAKIGDTYEATATVDEKKGKIVFTPLFSTFAKFPSGWNVEETVQDLQLNNPNISFKVNGNRVYAYGTEVQIKEITPLLANLEFITNKELAFVVKVLNYQTKDAEPEFIGFKKSLGNEMGYEKGNGGAVFIEKVIHLKHNDIFGFQFKDQFISIKLDMVKEKVIFNNHYELPMNEMSELGYVFTTIDKTSKDWDLLGVNKDKVKKFIVEMSLSDI